MNTLYDPLEEKIYPRPFKEEEESYLSPAIDKDTTPHNSPTDYEPPNRLTDTFFSYILKIIKDTVFFLIGGFFIIWVLAKLFG